MSVHIQLVPSPVSPMLGLVTYLTEVELHSGDPNVFIAAARGPDMHSLGYKTGASLVGSGAGLCWEDARGAAIGECLERYAACIVESENLLISSYDSLINSNLNAHEPSTWALFDQSQKVPYPAFSNDLIIAWSEGWDLVTNKPIFLPANFAHLSSSPILREWGANLIGPAVSTGCACATSINEGLLKGFCELIERDAFMIVWRNSLPVPEVIIDEDTDLYQVYTSRFARPGLEYHIWCTTLDFPIPSFFGVLFDHRGAEMRMVVGGAANLDAEKAVQKTLCELIQGLSWLEYMGEQKKCIPIDFNDIHSFTDRALLYSTPRDLQKAYSFLFKNFKQVPLSSIKSKRGTADEMLQYCVDAVVNKGFQPSAIDLTTDDVRECGYVVTRVVIPGLETMDGDHRLQMLGGTRWRKVPMELGLLPSIQTIKNINPFPHPYP
ncbi:YcaO-like family protein [Pontibacter toksunensis]|uniref:YcaO-like family protein n=1 Tax=Pontibacter toksunensis TaxID=1332631 RepID=A0ABW6BYT9_9BACT